MLGIGITCMCLCAPGSGGVLRFLEVKNLRALGGHELRTGQTGALKSEVNERVEQSR